MKLYIEIIFLDNFLADTMLLWLASRFAARRRFRRIAAGGAVGGIYAVAASAYPLLAAPLLKLPFGFLLALVTFGRSAPKGYLFFLLWSVLLGGAAYALRLTHPTGGFSTHGRILLIASLAVIIAAELLKRTGFTPSESVTMQADLGGFTLVFPAEYDSGCAVKDHRGNTVILIDRCFAEKNIPHVILSRAKTRLFPITTAAGCRMLRGIKPNRITITDCNSRADAWIILADHIDLNGCPAIFGKGLITESEERKCRHFSGSIFSGLSRFFRRTAATISTAASRFLRRSPKKRNPPSCKG